MQLIQPPSLGQVERYMLYPGKPIKFTADQVSMVRKGIGETQADFAVRFSRSRYSVMRWEEKGVTFKYRSNRFEVWHGAVSEAIHRTILRSQGPDDERLRKLRELRLLSRE